MMFVRILVTAGLALVLHVLFGWAWSVVAGVAAGFWVGRRGWLVGGLAVGLDWLVLVLYNLVVAPDAVARMLTVVGSLLGNLPGVVVVGVTLFLGALLGMLGGALGTQVARLVRRVGKGFVPVRAHVDSVEVEG